jgi:pimeloyl-ACP methyl ester carboxylesterase
MRILGYARRAARRLAREAASTSLAVTIGLGGWLFGPADPAAAAVPGIASWRVDHVAGQSLPDPVTASPARVARFFAGLSSADRQRLANRYPKIVGNLDGAPVALRLAVNARRAAKLAGRQVLEYDPRGDGRVAEVVGDLTTADRIAVIVPGVDSRLDNFDRSTATKIRRSPSWQAHQLLNQIHSADPTARVAVIAWLGYDPPEGIGRDAIREERAAAGAKALDRFVAGLAAYRPAAALTVIGHSYGSVVTGLAAHAFGSRVRDVVAIGSPGMGVNRAADLHTSARVWAGSAAADWTRNLPGIKLFGAGHGTLPVAASFGARILPTLGAVDHDGYFLPGTDSLRAMAGVVLGTLEPAAPRS